MKNKHSKSRSVLVIEDDLELSSVVDRILLNIDPKIHLDWATTAEEAIIILTKNIDLKKSTTPYDLIICDIFLEGANTGIDLWKFSNSHFPKMKFIFISGIEVEKLNQLLKNETKTPVLLKKPFSISECHQLLEKILLEK